MKYLRSILVLGLALLMISCSEDNPVSKDKYEPTPVDLTQAQKEVVNSGNKFGFKLFSEVLKNEESGKNVFISPFSVSVALGMTYNGSNGTTREAMQNTLELHGLTLQEVNESYKSLMNLFLGLDPKVKFEIANSIWSKMGYPLKQDFVDLNKNYFDAVIREVDFNDPATKDVINQWAEDKTNGKITELLDEIPANVVMYLINALYFKGSWSYEFDPEETTDSKFVKEDGSEVDCRMMNMSSKFMFYGNEDFQAVNLPYGNENYNMMIFLPRYGKTVDDFMVNFTEANWNTWLAGLDSNEMKLSLPRFKFKYDILLNDALTALGMGIAFGGACDLSNIFEGHNNLYISRVIHKTFVEVNEEGTEAAAVTAVEIRETSMNDAYMTCNRPFVFAIYEKETKSLLFIGRVADPTAE